MDVMLKLTESQVRHLDDLLEHPGFYKRYDEYFLMLYMNKYDHHGLFLRDFMHQFRLSY